MCELGDALTTTGYLPFLAAGVMVDARDVPHLRLAGDAQIVRKLSDASWQVMRTTLISAIDKMRSAPLDDLTRV